MTKIHVDFIINSMKVAYRLAEAKHAHFSKWVPNEELTKEMTIHLASLVEDEANKIREELLDA